MANNPFTSAPKTKNDVYVNSWDWSHVNNVTTELGRITPVFCQRVPAKTSFSIDATFGLKFMPFMFPIQTPIKARFSVFSMPVRALWKNYKEWISSVNMRSEDGQDINSKYVPPFISISTDEQSELFKKFEDYFGTCSNADLLGLPSTLDSSSNGILTVPLEWPQDRAGVTVCEVDSSFEPQWQDAMQVSSDTLYLLRPFGSTHFPSTTYTLKAGSDISLRFNYLPLYTTIDMGEVVDNDLQQADNNLRYLHLCSYSMGSTDNEIILSYLSCSVKSLSFDINGICTAVYTLDSDVVVNTSPSFALVCQSINGYSNSTNFTNVWFDASWSSGSDVDYNPQTCPWYDNVTKTGLKVSSLPFRMFEAIYNAYIRDIRNNPLVVDGMPKYNDFVLCYDKDGDDSENYGSLGAIKGETSSLDYFYGRKYGNWEPDRFSTCVPSPQQGQAPLVGLTNYAQVVKLDDGSDVTKLNSVLTDEDGHSYQVNYISDKEGLKNVELTELSALDSLGKPVNNVYQAVSEGISIEDLRQVNAYTRYLELNMRRGYSYKDITEGRYDVNIRYDDLLMPAFHGGFTRDVAVMPVTQTTPTSESGTYQGALGSQAGDGFVKGDSNANINFFCDEDSIVMCLIQVSPVPIYSQSLDKNTWLIESPLDILTPEFTGIGFQPITMSEVAPIQAKNNNVSLTDVFGYQRAWSEYMSRFDVAHGLFRSQLKNFIMKRTWQGSPELSKDFLLVKPDQVNQVFSVTETTDKIFGQVLFNMRVKNIAPRSLTPRLE